jgi:hypothetical protein
MLPLVFGAADETAAPTRNTCPTCGGIANFFDQNDLDKFEEQDRQYYQGNGAPAPSTTIQWFKAFSDGSAQQFMNSFFFFSCRCSLLYSEYVSFGIGFVLAMVSASATPKAVLSKLQQMHLKLRIHPLEIEGCLSGTLAILLSLVVHTLLNRHRMIFSPRMATAFIDVFFTSCR